MGKMDLDHDRSSGEDVVPWLLAINVTLLHYTTLHYTPTIHHTPVEIHVIIYIPILPGRQV